jgi:CheY-like chemotaxis protein
MKCPRCSAGITTAPDPGGFITCAGCGARLRTIRPAAEKAAGAAATPPVPRPAPLVNSSEADSLLTSLTPDVPTAPAFPDQANPSSTLPPGTPLPRIPRTPSRKPGEDTAKVAHLRPVNNAAAASNVTLDILLEEIRAVQETQAEIIALLRAPRPSAGLPSMSEAGGASYGFPDDEAPAAPSAPASSTGSTPVRSRRRKSVLLIDDDEETRQAAVAALQTAEVPVRAVASGNEGLAAIAEAKPDVIVMELGVGGEMGGKDVVNMIKATMEWVDIPIVLYTRLPIESQKEARTIHGADELILKSGGPDALVTRVIAIFRKG